MYNRPNIYIVRSALRKTLYLTLWPYPVNTMGWDGSVASLLSECSEIEDRGMDQKHRYFPQSGNSKARGMPGFLIMRLPTSLLGSVPDY